MDDFLDDVACELCGCTENEPCEGGCYWTEDPAGLMRDICSRCAGLVEEQLRDGLIPCEKCDSEGFTTIGKGKGSVRVNCKSCGGDGWFNVDPAEPTDRMQSRKVPVLQVRYNRGLPLFDPRDKSDHEQPAGATVGQ